MAGFDMQRVIAAFQAGSQLRQQKERKVQEDEDRTFELQRRKRQLALDELDDKQRRRKEAQENISMNLFPVAQEMQVPKAPLMPMPIGGGPEPAPIQPEGTNAVPLPLPARTVPGVYEPDQQLPTTSLQQHLGQIAQQQREASQLKREENTVQLPPIPGLGLNQPTSIDKSLADNVLTQAGSNVRQGQQQEFTAGQNEANAKAAAERAKLDRESREKIARDRIAATAANELKNGQNTRTVGQAATQAQRYDSNPIVKKYAVVKEANDFVKTLGGTSTDDQALIYAFAKVMDPDSVVREGEYATVQKYAQSWADSFRFNAQRIFSNSPFLSPEARKQMIATIDKRAQATEKTYRNFKSQTVKKFEEIGVDPSRWMVDYNTDGGAEVTTTPDGKKWRKDGDTMVEVP